MSCPTCDSTMQSVGGGIFWCPQCGTQKGDGGKVWVPALVERCRAFAPSLERLPPDTAAETAWHRLGIAEAINKPPTGRSTP